MAAAPTTAEPQPGGTGKPMTPAERARHASLVRWGKEQPFAARLAALRGKRRGGKAGGKGKAAKPKLTPEQRKAQQQAQKDANRESVLRGFNIAPDGAAALAALRNGTQPDDPKTIASHGFVEAGLVEQAKDGSYRLSASGRAMLRAAESGDKGRAGDIISSARDRTSARTERQKAREERLAKRKGKSAPATKDTDMSDYTAILDDLQALADELTELGETDAALKAGRRNSTGDQGLIDQGYELAEQLCDLFEALGADTGEEEAEEGDGNDLEADMAGEDEPAGKAQTTFGGKERSDLGDSDFAGPNRTFPIMTAQDVKDAAKLIGKAENPDAVKRKIIAIAKRKGFADAIPDAWKDGATKKDIAASDLLEMVYGSEIKALAGDTIGGFAVLFGTADTPDLSHQRDYFTKTTDYWLDRFGWPRPMTYHHGMDEDTRDDPIVGTWTKAVIKEEGVWLEGQLDRAHKYHGAIKELVRRGYLKLSSDSAPQWVVRERQDNGANEVKRWPLITASPTVTPAEPRLAGVAFKALLAELGLEDIHDDPEADETDTSERADALKAVADRKRRLLLLQRQYELETTV